MTRLGEEEIAREARRVLRRLASLRTALFQRSDDFAVARSLASAAGSRLTLSHAFAVAFARAGWIAPDGPGRYVLTEAGRAFLVRSLGGPDRFAQQHRQMEIRQTDLGAVRVNVGESPLSRLKARGLVDGTQFAAGEKLRRDYTLGQLSPRMGVDWTQPVVSGGARGTDSISDIAMAARQRFTRAMAAAGPGLADVAFDVCCELGSVEQAESHRGWAKRSGRVVLGLALDRLALHYGLSITLKRAPIRALSFEAAGS
jgi:hypothetical protein